MKKELIQDKVLIGLQQSNIDVNKSLKDQGVNSIDKLEMIMNAEEDFGIYIPDNVADKLDTVQELITFIYNEIRIRRSGTV